MRLVFSTLYRAPRILTLHWNIQSAGPMKSSFAGLYWWPVRPHATGRSYWATEGEVLTPAMAFRKFICASSLKGKSAIGPSVRKKTRLSCYWKAHWFSGLRKKFQFQVTHRPRATLQGHVGVCYSFLYLINLQVLATLPLNQSWSANYGLNTLLRVLYTWAHQIFLVLCNEIILIITTRRPNKTQELNFSRSNG